jgi:Cu2+-containing amine oxidase
LFGVDAVARQPFVDWIKGPRWAAVALVAVVWLALCGVVGVVAQVAPVGVAAQVAPVGVVAQVDPPGPYDPLTELEIEQAQAVLLGDARMEPHLASERRTRFLTFERHAAAKFDPPDGVRRANVVFYDYSTLETVSATVSLGATPRVDALVTTTGRPPGLSGEELAEARALALEDGRVQAALLAAGISPPEQADLIVTHLMAAADDPADPCSSHRCVALFLNTVDAVVRIEPIIDLTALTVYVR